MSHSPSARRPVRSRLLIGPVGCLLGALVLSGCSEEPPPVDTTSVSSLQAGAADRLAAADVEVVALTEPTEATPGQVGSALSDAGLSPETLGSDQAGSLSISADDLTGIPTLIGDVADPDGSFVAVVFAQPADAWVFAATDPTVFSDEDVETDRAAYLAGPVVVFASTTGGAGTGDDVRRALRSLAGVEADPSGSATASPTSSPSSSPTG